MKTFLTSSLVVLAPIVLAGCPRANPDATPDAAALTADAASKETSKDAGPDAARTATKKTTKPTAPTISAADRREALRALDEGRKLSRKKDFTGAIAAFDRALKIDPTDARVLAEVGYAALQANDLPRAEAASTKALANAHDTKLRAQILYNQGRVQEAKGDRRKAIDAYAKSIALRDNAEVEKRMNALVSSIDPPAVIFPMPCMVLPMADVDAVCKCLLDDKSDYLAAVGPNPTCEAEKDIPPLGDPRLSVIRWAGGDMSETAHLLAFKSDKGMRVLSDLGHDYEPGAMGVHNTSEIKGGETKTVNGKAVVVVRSEEVDNDFNMAGLELCSDARKWETVCQLGASPQCVPVAVSTIGGCGPGVEPDPADLDDETKKAVAEIKAHASTKHAETSWSIGDDGKLVVRLIPGGTSDIVLKGMVGSHPLF